MNRRTVVLWLWLGVLLVAAGAPSWAQAEDAPTAAQSPESVIGGTAEKPLGLAEGTAPANTAAVAAPAQASSEMPKTKKKDLTSFFFIGGVINIAMLGVFVWWALGQLRGKGQRD